MTPSENTEALLRRYRERVESGEALGLDGLEAALAGLTPAQQAVIAVVLEALLEGVRPTQDYVARRLGINQSSAQRRLARVSRLLPRFLNAALDIKSTHRKQT